MRCHFDFVKIDKQLVHQIGREAAQQRGPEDDPDQDLDHSERQRVTQAGDPPEGDRQREDDESLNEEDRGGRDGGSCPDRSAG